MNRFISTTFAFFSCAFALLAGDLVFFENFSRFQPGTPACSGGKWHILESEGKHLLSLPDGGPVLSPEAWTFQDGVQRNYTFRIRFRFDGENRPGMLNFQCNKTVDSDSKYPYKHYLFTLTCNNAMLACVRANETRSLVDPLPRPPEVKLPEPIRKNEWYELACTVRDESFSASLTAPGKEPFPLYNVKINPGTGGYHAFFTGPASVESVTVTTADDK